MIDQEIKEVMATVFDVSIDLIEDDASTDTIEKWDSLRHMNLILALEEEFDISIPDEEVGSMTNYKLVKLIVTECKNE